MGQGLRDTHANVGLGEVPVEQCGHEVEDGLLALTSVDQAIEERRRLAEGYRVRFAGSEVISPPEPSNGMHVFNLFTIRVPGRDKVRERLAAAAVGRS